MCEHNMKMDIREAKYKNVNRTNINQTKTLFSCFVPCVLRERRIFPRPEHWVVLT